MTPTAKAWLCISTGSIVSLLLAGCTASRQQVAEGLGQKYVGQNVDALVGRFGPPASTFKMNSGDTSYVWQLGDQTSIQRWSSATATTNTEFCKITVIASPTGTVKQLNTEDPNIYVGMSRAVG